MELCHCLSPSGVELARLPLHPLMSELPEIQLRRALTAELVDATCRHGFNIFDALAHEHRAQVNDQSCFSHHFALCNLQISVP